MALTRTWLVLVALTVLALVVGRPGGQVSLGTVGVCVVLIASGVKAMLILRNFLGLGRASVGWQVFFAVYLVFIATGVLGAYVLAASGVLARAH